MKKTEIKTLAEDDFIRWMNDYEVGPLSEYEDLTFEDKQIYWQYINKMRKRCVKFLMQNHIKS